MDPATLALIVSALGPALVAVFTKLAEKGAIDPALEKGLEPFRNLLTRGYDKRKDEARLTKALQAALPAGEADARLFFALSDLKANPALATRAAAAVVEMTGDDPARLPPDLLRDLKLDDSHRPALATALFKLRAELVKLDGYREGVRYANELHALNRLDGLYELVAGLAATVTEADGVKALRVQIVPPDARALETPYLKNVMNEFAGLPLEGRSKDDTLRPDDQLRLERVYIALNTTERRYVPFSEEEIRRRNVGLFAYSTNKDLPPAPLSIAGGERLSFISALRAMMESRRLVLLGDPGSGKSTFAQHLCLCLAGSRLDSNGDWPRRLGAGDVGRWELALYPFPIFVRLRSFAHDTESLPDDPKQMGQAKHLWAFIQKELVQLGRDGLAGHVLDLLENGQAFVLFDGLDEVADPARREKVAQAIQHFAFKRFPYARILVTCRVRQYPLNAKGQPTAPWKLPGFPVATLADFDRDQINAFVKHWFDELYARGRTPDPQDKRESLLAAFATRPELGSQLAPKPILLTQMALVHAIKKLPDSRIDVYKECAGLLLWEWERLKARQSGRGESAEDVLAALSVPGLRLSEVEDALDKAVFEAHADGDPDVPAEKIRRALQQEVFINLHGLSSDKAIGCAEKFIVEWLRGRNGLLVPAEEDSFGVPHRSFREFMAARYLREHRLANPDTGDEESWTAGGPRLVKTGKDGLDTWREVFRFAAALDSPPEAAQALNELCSDQLTYDPAEVQRLMLAGEVARDVGPRTLSARSKLGRQVYERIESHLLHLLRDTDDSKPYPDDPPRFTPPNILSPKTRLAAGELLDALGWTPPDLFDFVEIRSHEPEVTRSGQKMGSAFILHPSSFFLAKYPVTNLQYQRFLESDDYDKDYIWQNVAAFDADQKTPARNMGDEAWDWFNKNGGKERRPRHWDHPRLGRSRHLFPVVGVTWYEAAAYCVWLERNLADLPEGQTLTSNFKPFGAAQGKLQTSKLALRLPTEDEWEKAVGSKWKDAKVEKETPRYAWQEIPAKVGDEIVKYANTSESDLGGTTPVCMYPAGMSPATVMDMSGNVWEWQANLYEKGKPYRAFRGGSWTYNGVNARVAARNNYHPYDDWNYDGFRVCAFPG
jgi:formylglycine-generating enzyme required for sulfatase activity